MNPHPALVGHKMRYPDLCASEAQIAVAAVAIRAVVTHDREWDRPDPGAAASFLAGTHPDVLWVIYLLPDAKVNGDDIDLTAVLT